MRIKINGVELMDINRTVIIEKEMNDFLELSGTEVNDLLTVNSNQDIIFNIKIDEVSHVSKENFSSVISKLKESNISPDNLTLNYTSDNQEVLSLLQEAYNHHMYEIFTFVTDLLDKIFIFPVSGIF